jgi:peroxiredoxin
MAPEELDRLAVDKVDFPLLRALKEGDIAPPLSLPNAGGQLVHSRELLRVGPVVLTFYRGVWCPYCQRDLKALAETVNVIKTYGVSLVAIAHQTVPDSNRKFEQENNLGFPILDDTSGIAAAAFGIGWTSECLREMFEQFSADTTGLIPRSQPSSQCKPATSSDLTTSSRMRISTSTTAPSRSYPRSFSCCSVCRTPSHKGRRR